MREIQSFAEQASYSLTGAASLYLWLWAIRHVIQMNRRRSLMFL